jgi:hypothetical protein
LEWFIQNNSFAKMINLKKLLFLVLIFVIYTNWHNEKHLNEFIRPHYYNRYLLKENGIKIRFNLECSEKCDLYYLNESNALLFEKNLNFSSLYKNLGIYSTRFQDDIISKEKLYIYILNPNSLLTVKSSLIIEIYLIDEEKPIFPLAPILGILLFK